VSGFAAVASSRKPTLRGSHRRAAPSRARSWIQAVSSLARAAISHHSWFSLKPRRGSKMIKRQMFSPAGLPLLRKRVLLTARN
jgi:hypothetical protein